MIVLGILLGMGTATAAPIDVKKCEKNFAVLKDLDKAAKPWAAFHKYFKANIPACDDGYFADGTSDLVMRLVGRGVDLPGLAKEASSDKGFRKFILSRVNTTATDDQLLAVEKATQTCPKKSEALCKELAAEAKAAQAKLKSKDQSDLDD